MRFNASFYHLHISLLCISLVMLGCNRKQKETELQKQYFARCARYDVVGEHVVAVDPHNPRVITMDSWFEIIFAAADGQHTVGDYITQVSSEYPGGAPQGLTKQISEFVEKMVAEGLIRLSPIPVDLPYYLALPVSKQDPEKAKELMIRDGVIKADSNEPSAEPDKE